MKLVRWTPVLFCIAAVFTAAAAKDIDYPNVPEEVSMFADDQAPRGYTFHSSYGSPLYVSDADGKDKSNCIGECVETWAPVKARDDATPVNKDWTLISRPEGYKQWSYKGHPIYVNIPEVMGEKASAPKGGPWRILVP